MYLYTAQNYRLYLSFINDICPVLTGVVKTSYGHNLVYKHVLGILLLGINHF